jgi:hypothetical protein
MQVREVVKKRYRGAHFVSLTVGPLFDPSAAPVQTESYLAALSPLSLDGIALATNDLPIWKALSDRAKQRLPVRRLVPLDSHEASDGGDTFWVVGVTPDNGAAVASLSLPASPETRKALSTAWTLADAQGARWHVLLVRGSYAEVSTFAAQDPQADIILRTGYEKYEGPDLIPQPSGQVLLHVPDRASALVSVVLPVRRRGEAASCRECIASALELRDEYAKMAEEKGEPSTSLYAPLILKSYLSQMNAVRPVTTPVLFHLESWPVVQ